MQGVLPEGWVNKVDASYLWSIWEAKAGDDFPVVSMRGKWFRLSSLTVANADAKDFCRRVCKALIIACLAAEQKHKECSVAAAAADGNGLEQVDWVANQAVHILFPNSSHLDVASRTKLLDSTEVRRYLSVPQTYFKTRVVLLSQRPGFDWAPYGDIVLVGKGANSDLNLLPAKMKLPPLAAGGGAPKSFARAGASF